MNSILNTTHKARFVQWVLGSKQPSLHVWPHSWNNCRTSWVRQTNRGLRMSYTAHAVAYAAYQSIHLVYKALSVRWFMKAKLSSTMQRMAHFMGHKTRGDGDCMDYHVRENKQWDVLTGKVNHPPQTWLIQIIGFLNETLLSLWWESLNDCNLTVKHQHVKSVSFQTVRHPVHQCWENLNYFKINVTEKEL